IPRPRNAFILFRCLFVSQQAVPASVEKDHRNISRIAGRVWKSMSEDERDPWIKAAELEKTRHEQRWPGYRY
ncbi:high mobility group box domain-containing protein, partial [Gautieria morchelliformis]